MSRKRGRKLAWRGGNEGRGKEGGQNKMSFTVHKPQGNPVKKNLLESNKALLVLLSNRNQESYLESKIHPRLE